MTWNNFRSLLRPAHCMLQTIYSPMYSAQKWKMFCPLTLRNAFGSRAIFFLIKITSIYWYNGRQNHVAHAWRKIGLTLYLLKIRFLTALELSKCRSNNEEYSFLACLFLSYHLLKYHVSHHNCMLFSWIKSIYGANFGFFSAEKGQHSSPPFIHAVPLLSFMQFPSFHSCSTSPFIQLQFPSQYSCSFPPFIQAVPLPSFMQFPSIHSGSSPHFNHVIPSIHSSSSLSFIQAVPFHSFRQFPPLHSCSSPSFIHAVLLLSFMQFSSFHFRQFPSLHSGSSPPFIQAVPLKRSKGSPMGSLGYNCMGYICINLFVCYM